MATAREVLEFVVGYYSNNVGGWDENNGCVYWSDGARCVIGAQLRGDTARELSTEWSGYGFRDLMTNGECDLDEDIKEELESILPIDMTRAEGIEFQSFLQKAHDSVVVRRCGFGCVGSEFVTEMMRKFLEFGGENNYIRYLEDDLLMRVRGMELVAV